MQQLERKAQMHDARVNLCKKDGGRAQISSVGQKLLYEISPVFLTLWVFIIPCYSEPTEIQIQRVD
jgi:hypothetical protein